MLVVFVVKFHVTHSITFLWFRNFRPFCTNYYVTVKCVSIDKAIYSLMHDINFVFMQLTWSCRFSSINFRPTRKSIALSMWEDQQLLKEALFCNALHVDAGNSVRRMLVRVLGNSVQLPSRFLLLFSFMIYWSVNTMHWDHYLCAWKYLMTIMIIVGGEWMTIWKKLIKAYLEVMLQYSIRLKTPDKNSPYIVTLPTVLQIVHSYLISHFG
jgi:hypothetical protein